MLLAIIASRWLMPKGDLSRDQLSALLVMYVATASDIVDLFNIIEEIVTFKKAFDFHLILTGWTWSMFQFPFVRTATRSNEVDPDDPEDAIPEDPTATNSKVPCHQRIKSGLLSWLENESWSLMITIVFQDGPFLAVRVYLALTYDTFNRTTLFFIGKNVMVLVLQFYRLLCLHMERRKHKEERTMELQRNTLTRLSRRSFIKNFMETRTGKREKV